MTTNTFSNENAFSSAFFKGGLNRYKIIVIYNCYNNCYYIVVFETYRVKNETSVSKMRHLIVVFET